MKISKKQAQLIIRMYEGAYRRGVQQGIAFYEQGLMSEEDATTFRFKPIKNDAPWLPQCFKNKKAKRHVAEPILCEAGHCEDYWFIHDLVKLAFPELLKKQPTKTTNQKGE